MITLSPRQAEVLVLIGRDRLSYKAVAKKLRCSRHTVRQHAEEARRRMGSSLAPRDALTEYYWLNRAEFEGAA